ncbi:MAG: hypothetical protein HQK89_10475 [Nitrospirae bacterium]|nr:hypothetical protein [Nitrospirota bacterium]
MTDNRFSEVHQYLDDAVFLHDCGMAPEMVVVKLYHAMVYALFELLGVRRGGMTQAEAIAGFDAGFVKKGIFPVEKYNTIHRAYGLRNFCGCTQKITVSDDDVVELTPKVREFVESIEAYLISEKVIKP